MTSKDLVIKIDNLRYELDDVDVLMRSARKEAYEKGDYLSELRLHTVCVRLYDLLEALENLTVDAKRIIEGVDL